MSVSRIFEYTDADAPTMESNTAGTLINVLKKCLVEGYGSTPSLGWTVPFEDVSNHKIVFRASEGTRVFIQIDDGLTANNFQFVKVCGFESMTTVDSGLTPIPLPDQGNYTYIFKNTGSSSGNIPWRLIGDSKGFYFFTKPLVLTYGENNPQGYGKVWYPHFLGDYIPYDLSNFHNFLMALADTTGYGPWRFGIEEMYLKRSPGFAEIGSVKAKWRVFQAGVDGIFGFVRISPSPSPVNGRRVYDPVVITTLAVGSQRGDQLVGWMPGLLSEWWSSQKYADTGQLGMYLNELVDQVDEFNGRKILTMPVRNYGSSPISACGRVSVVIGEGFRNVH